MSEKGLVEGRVVQVDAPKAVGTYGNWKMGVKVEATQRELSGWYSILEKQIVINELHQRLQVGGTIKASYEQKGQWRNIEKVFETGGRGPKPLEDALEPKKDLPVKDEILGVEDQEAEEDRHYIQAWARACRIAEQVRGKTPRAFQGDEETRFKLVVFEKLTSPLTPYLRENIRRARAEAGVK